MKYKPIYSLILLALVCFGSSLAAAQESDRDAGIKAFQSGDYSMAISLLKRATKADTSDAKSWSFLGSSYLQKNQPKDAIKALERAIKLEPKSDVHLSALAVAYIMTSDYRASKTADEALAINPKSIDAQYVLASLALKAGSFNIAYQRAKRIIELNPMFAFAYHLKSIALVGSFSLVTGMIQKSPDKRHELLAEAAADLEKFIDLTADPKITKAYETQLEALKTFADHYRHLGNGLVTAIGTSPLDDPSRTSLKIISKPLPGYTDEARQKGAQGTVRLLVAFQSDGNIGPIMIVKSLDRSLDAAAVRAVRGIRFVPETKDGKAVTAVKQVEYTFSIY